MERLQKILSARGLASRRAAEEWIKAGRVTVNGKTAALGDTADADTDEICVDGNPLPRQERLVYLVLHKPRGYVTTLHDEKGRPDAAQLVADCGARVYPVGRLDMDSEGLLLFTNDGAFANRLMHPSHQVEKTYEVQVSGYAAEKLTLLRRPIVLDGYRIAPPEVRLLRRAGDKAWVQVVIHEGRNRQVRRMCQAAGLTVLRLKRTREGDLRLGDLPLGKWRSLTEAEIENLKK
ncbi:rRNA pseudouridine synthase [Pseudoflavonifractor sp. MSJ-30]|uniref:pseudouridine synthase n=1 Tax=Pseudoflavonifractor sp. MSJ-30 TaxID=2841525 RepID=UPI001C11D0F2|nr:pseudouridine synthase [Pseudoflavonifractor sp. MSJ-30]MBU5451969.1 rRNA pseudouridine synthase [Pseudoflavonifractor sp. MSJ-30]